MPVRIPVRFAIHLALARLLTQWRSLLTIIAGTVLSASIGALVPLYTTAVSQVGMTQRLAAEPAQDVHVAASISLRASAYTDRGGLRQIADDVTNEITLPRVAADLGGIAAWVDEVIVYQETEAMGVLLVPDGVTPHPANENLEPLTGVRTRLAYYDDWQNRVRIVAGRLPDLPLQHAEQFGEDIAEDMEIVISLTTANELNLAAGQLIILDQGMSPQGSRGGGHSSSQPIIARIVGIVTPLDDEAPYWMDPAPLRLLDRSTGAAPWAYQFVSLTIAESAYRAATEFLPDTPTKIGWRVLFDHDKLPFAQIDQARAALRTFARNLRAACVDTPNSANDATQNLGFNYHTRLIDYDVVRTDQDSGILLDYAKRQELLAAPFGLLLLQIGVLVLFFLMVTAALVRRGERREIAMLQSRGALDSQIMFLRGIEALLICIFAVIVAPLLAQQLLRWLGPSVANTDDFPLPLTGRVFVFAGIAAGVTFLTLIGTLPPVLRMPLVAAGGAAQRSVTRQWWQAYYLDAVLALVGLGALWLLVRRGSPLADVNLGGQQADPLMLLAPALLFLALGSLALRFFPIIAGIAARIAATRAGLLGALASWQLSREPVHYGRITFLLALAIGIGWFATSFRATVTNSHDDQAEYRVGTDVRFTERDTRLNVNRARPAASYLAHDDVVAASTALRVFNTNLSTNRQSNINVNGTLLAIDPATFAGDHDHDTGERLTYWRADLGAITLPHDPDDELAWPERGRALPFVPDKIGLWARFDTAQSAGVTGITQFQPDVDRLTQRTDLALRFLDADDAWIVVPVSVAEIEYERVGTDAPGLGAAAYLTSGWVYLEADLSALTYTLVAPLKLVSAYWTYRSDNADGESGNRLTLADMTLIDAAGEVTPFTIFSDPTWTFQYDRGATAEGDTYATHNVSGRTDALRIQWAQDAQRTVIGALLNYPAPPVIDAVISRRMQEINALTWGSNAAPFTIWNIGGVHPQFRAVDVVDYFPSLYDTMPTEANPAGDSFMVVDVRALLYWLNRRPSATVYPDEVWVRLAEDFDQRDPAAVAAFLRSLESLDRYEAGGVVILSDVSLAAELSKLRTDPLSLGLLGLMYLAFII
ncbi:MAG: ABC transporter permease, partial [Anaerolineae bacterium]|nr:ABC transporter permease [Anaerolineae bacterium]